MECICNYKSIHAFNKSWYIKKYTIFNNSFSTKLLIDIILYFVKLDCKKLLL